MIQIDDAGSGSLVGGTMIGIIRVESNEFINEVIPIKCFQGSYFKDKKYQDVCTDIVNIGLIKLNVNKDELIEICQGYIFDKACDSLTQMGYNIKKTKISDPLQTLIEKSFMEYVIGLGIPLDYLKYTKYPFHFHRLLKWVLADMNSRCSLCKTGWKSWIKYSNVNVLKYQDHLITGNYNCLKCGLLIKTPNKISVLKFTTNRNYYIYLHNICPKLK